ncbi:MAG: quinolinate synthase NadA [Actinomycetota bacterium]|nr:quinolinate synthase NadA [Actinomycetota bacterium]MDA3026493.1 quinolinate synthase NadA [Actinomycetota bacterium]
MAPTWTEPAPTPLLHLLGNLSDQETEKGVECPGELPKASAPDLVQRALVAKEKLGDRLFILGHHYQRDEVVQFADTTGDSFKLAKDAAARPNADYIIFCGVHFMAESADILTSDLQNVILPDLAAGCSMADMAEISQVETCWSVLEDLGIAKTTVPVVYMNSTAAIKSFTGNNGGTVCTSSNAQKALEWSFNKGERVLFLPDQHLGRNTAVMKLGLKKEECVVFNPLKPRGGLTDAELMNAKMILWKGHCSVHARFNMKSVEDVRQRIKDVKIIVHPECVNEVAEAADVVASTEGIIKTIKASPAGTSWAVGTELNLVRRLARENSDKNISFLDKTICYCSTMNRIDLPHLVASLENLVAGNIVNQIKVDPETKHYARIALNQMLALPGN